MPKDFLNKLGEMHTAERELTLALPLIAFPFADRLAGRDLWLDGDRYLRALSS